MFRNMLSLGLSSTSALKYTSLSIFRKFSIQHCLLCKRIPTAEELKAVKAARIKMVREKSFVPENIEKEEKKFKRSIVNYCLSGALILFGTGFAAVPLYDKFCRTTNYGGLITVDLKSEKSRTMEPVKDHELVILFNADKNSYLQWKFQPLQQEIMVVPGETVLAFYSAENPTDRPISGISTYGVVPFEAAQYFNKIQCFCFDEQRLNPHERVDMPVLFYVDPDYAKDATLFNVRTLTLSYTFFEAQEGIDLPFMESFTDDMIIDDDDE